MSSTTPGEADGPVVVARGKQETVEEVFHPEIWDEIERSAA
jgi:hypothetical protein